MLDIHNAIGESLLGRYNRSGNYGGTNMASDLHQLVRQIEALTPEERSEIRRAIEAAAPQTPDEVFERKLREMGLVSQFGRKRQPRRRPNPVPVRIAGKPLSESLIEERR